MAISEKTIKIIWGNAAARCVICRKHLILPSEKETSDSLIGEICHIISKQVDGPRYDPNISDRELLDMPDNLLLLCRNHHKLIDDHCNEYTPEKLRKIKKDHEEFVRKSFLLNKDKEIYLRRIYTGKELLGILDGAFAYEIDYDTPKNEEEKKKISLFLNYCTITVDVADLTGISNKMEVEKELTELMTDVEKIGYFCFAESLRKKVKNNSGLDELWKIAAIYVRSKDNKEIIVKEIKEN